MIKNKYFLIKVVLTIIISIIFIISNSLFSFPLLNSTKNILQKDIDKFIYTQYTIEDENSYFVVSDYFILLNENVQQKTNILMQQKSSTYSLLQKRNYTQYEIGITKNLAKKLKKSVGDVLIIENPYNHQNSFYKVVEILEDVQISENTADLDLVIIGWDNQFEIFKSENESLIIKTKKDEFIDNLLASNIVDATSIIFKNNVYVFVVILIQIIMVYIFLEYFNSYDTYTKKYIKKLYLYGETVSLIRKKMFFKIILLLLILLTPLSVYFIINKNLLYSLLLLPIIFYIVFDLKINSYAVKSLR